MEIEESGEERSHLRLRAVVTACQLKGWFEADGVRLLGLEVQGGPVRGPSDPYLIGLTVEAATELQRQMDLVSALGTELSGFPVQ